MKALVNKKTGELHKVAGKIVVDHENNTINGVKYVDGLPDAEVIDITYVEQDDLEFDRRYQSLKSELSYDVLSSTVTLVKSVINWRTLEEVEAEEAEAAAAAIDVTPDSPDSA